MWGWIALSAGGLLVAGLSLGGALVVSLRTKFPPVLTGIRRMNRRFWNPRAMRTAGKAGAAVSVIRHLGRSTGTPYATPVGVAPTEDGFMIALPYGTTPDWVRNVRMAGSAVIDTGGRSYRVHDPRVVGPEEVERYLSGKERLTHRVYGVDQFLVLRRADAGVAVGDDR